MLIELHTTLVAMVRIKRHPAPLEILSLFRKETNYYINKTSRLDFKLVGIQFDSLHLIKETWIEFKAIQAIFLPLELHPLEGSENYGEDLQRNKSCGLIEIPLKASKVRSRMVNPRDFFRVSKSSK